MIGFRCLPEGKTSFASVCTFDSRRELSVQATLIVERTKPGKAWKPYQTAQDTQAFSSTGPQSISTTPVTPKCKPRHRFRATAYGDLYTEAAGRQWLTDFEVHPEQVKLRCKKK